MSGSAINVYKYIVGTLPKNFSNRRLQRAGWAGEL